MCYCLLFSESGLDQTSKMVGHHQPYKPSKLSENSMALASNYFWRLHVPFAPIATNVFFIFQCFHCLFICFLTWSIALLSPISQFPYPYFWLADTASIPYPLWEKKINDLDLFALASPTSTFISEIKCQQQEQKPHCTPTQIKYWLFPV